MFESIPATHKDTRSHKKSGKEVPDPWSRVPSPWSLLPVCLLLALMLACGRTQPVPPNRQQPLTSPSGEYVLTLPIEENEVNPEYQGTPVWKVTISDAEGNLLYRDEASELVGYLSVYWAWDGEDRVWLYSSDTGDVFFWELADGAWVKTRWGHGRVREIDRDLEPPPELYPAYVD